MATWEHSVYTNKGKALMSKLISGNTLSITRVVSGAGYVDPSSLPYQTGVTNEKQTLSFSTQSYPEEGKCKLPVRLTNTGVNTEYIAMQIGVYAYDPDEGEILYFIAQAAENDGDKVFTEAEMPGFSAEWNFYITYTQEIDVSVTVDPSNTINAAEAQAMIDEHNSAADPHPGKLVAKATFDSHLENHANPHQVTAEQLGLGNVDNTSDANKYVAYASNAGQAARVPNSLTVRFNGGNTEGNNKWTFDGSTGRSVNITPAKIGASATGHKHSAEDVTSGTFATERIPTIPVTKGGTGATTPEEARDNLDVPSNLPYYGDMNDLLKSGFYSLNHNANLPDDIIYGQAIVSIGLETGGSCAQLVFNFNTHKIVSRRGVQDQSTGIWNWSAWSLIYNDQFLPQISDLFATGPTILSSHQYGDTLPATGSPGQIFFLKAQEGV